MIIHSYMSNQTTVDLKSLGQHLTAVVISFLLCLQPEAVCLTDNAPRDGSLVEMRTENKTGADHRKAEYGKPETQSKKGTTQPCSHTQLFSQISSNQNHICEA